MANIHDYLYWRGDISLEADPINELDGLVLTRFAYMPFEHLRFGSQETVGSLCKKLQALPEEDFRLEGDSFFVHLLDDAERYRDLPVTDFVKNNNDDIVIQFAAVTIHLPEDRMYIAYCGTDSTLTGWKEDFYMSFMEDVPAQKEALAYCVRLSEQYPEKNFLLGGHSKGGNLAIYTAVNLPEELKGRLLHVSNYDGPGFPKSFISTHDFPSVAERLYTWIPQESMIGRIHEHEEGFRIVESIENGIQQHNVYSWTVEPKKMTLLDTTDDTSEITYRAIQNILANTSPEERKRYIDRIFDLMMSTDANSFREVFLNLPGKMTDVMKSVKDMSSADLKEGTEVTATMVRSFLDAALSYHEENRPNFGEILDKLTFEPTLPNPLEKLLKK